MPDIILGQVLRWARQVFAQRANVQNGIRTDTGPVGGFETIET